MSDELSRRTCDFCHKIGVLQWITWDNASVQCSHCRAIYRLPASALPATRKPAFTDHETDRVERKDPRYIPECEFNEDYGRFIRWYMRRERQNEKRWGLRDLQRRGFEVEALVLAEDGREIKHWKQ